MKSLGLTATNEAVTQALTEMYPNGVDGIDQGDLIRRVFLNLKAKKK